MAVRSIFVNVIARVGQFQSEIGNVQKSISAISKEARGINSLLAFAGLSFGVGSIAKMFNDAAEATRRWGKEIRDGKKTIDEIASTRNLSMVLGSSLIGEEARRKYQESQLALGAAAGGTPADFAMMAGTVANKFMSWLTETLGGTLEELMYAVKEGTTIPEVYNALQDSSRDILRYEKMRLEHIRKQAEWEKWWTVTRKRALDNNERLYNAEAAEKQARLQEEADKWNKRRETADAIIEAQKTMAQKTMEYAKTLDELGMAGMLTQEQITRAMKDFERSMVTPMRGGSAEVVSQGMDIGTMAIGGDNAIIKQLMASNQHLSQIEANTRYSVN